MGKKARAIYISLWILFIINIILGIVYHVSTLGVVHDAVGGLHGFEAGMKSLLCFTIAAILLLVNVITGVVVLVRKHIG